jgi:hypothetical protein
MMNLTKFELAFKLGVEFKTDIDSEWRMYRGGLSYGEFIVEWVRKKQFEGGTPTNG